VEHLGLRGEVRWHLAVTRTYGPAAVLTVAIWAVVGAVAGWAGLLAVITLTVLEVTFSFDNAVVNSKLLTRMSSWWQGLFMTAGILIAVFVVRFALPVLIVSVTAHLGFVDVVHLAASQPHRYGLELAKAGPMIDAFGGTFLLMIALAFFLDESKDIHWVGWLERRLAPLGRFDNIGIFVMLGVGLAIAATTDHSLAVLAASMCGIALHVGLDIFGTAVDGDRSPRAGQLVGAAAAVMFLRLEVLDASFSFDGVIGAFAISSSVLVIMAGLGAGAMWVRAMTVHLVRAGTLAKFRYLEHGAHWAIAFLGAVMIMKLYEVDPPEWITGTLGLVFISLAVATSVVAERREQRAPRVLAGSVST
jgi:uncharacterized protein